VSKLALRHARCTCVKPGYVDCGAAVGRAVMVHIDGDIYVVNVTVTIVHMDANVAGIEVWSRCSVFTVVSA